MVRKRDLVAYTEHHGEGILEFHVTDPSHAISARECLTAALLIAATLLGCYLLGMSPLPYWQHAAVGGATTMLLLRRLGQIQTESLLVVHDLGVQVRREYFSGKKDLKFVERSRIHDVIINEGIRYATVTYYLAIMVNGSDKMLLGFEELIPELPHLLVAYHGLRNVLFGDEWPENYRPSSSDYPGMRQKPGEVPARTEVGAGLNSPQAGMSGQRALYLGGDSAAPLTWEARLQGSQPPNEEDSD